mmetsp:Transcript_24383/g.66523  ORF Transcript_24383/g.66523 Transcript_24383/m.66523 type:complete len:525 (-) Transcript_24383:1273-2847(-)
MQRRAPVAVHGVDCVEHLRIQQRLAHVHLAFRDSPMQGSPLLLRVRDAHEVPESLALEQDLATRSMALPGSIVERSTTAAAGGLQCSEPLVIQQQLADVRMVPRHSGQQSRLGVAVDGVGAGEALRVQQRQAAALGADARRKVQDCAVLDVHVVNCCELGRAQEQLTDRQVAARYCQAHRGAALCVLQIGCRKPVGLQQELAAADFPHARRIVQRRAAGIVDSVHRGEVRRVQEALHDRFTAMPGSLAQGCAPVKVSCIGNREPGRLEQGCTDLDLVVGSCPVESRALVLVPRDHGSAIVAGQQLLAALQVTRPRSKVEGCDTQAVQRVSAPEVRRVEQHLAAAAVAPEGCQVQGCGADFFFWIGGSDRMSANNGVGLSRQGNQPHQPLCTCQNQCEHHHKLRPRRQRHGGHFLAGLSEAVRVGVCLLRILPGGLVLLVLVVLDLILILILVPQRLRRLRLLRACSAAAGRCPNRNCSSWRSRQWLLAVLRHRARQGQGLRCRQAANSAARCNLCVCAYLQRVP